MKKKTRQTILWTLLILVIIGLFVFFLYREAKKPGVYDDFAQCITNSGAIFYGAFWCPHCQAQKAMFGKSANLIPYEECSTPDGRGQNELCIEQDIQGYPTWEFADGSRRGGTLSLEELAELTSCELISA